MVPLQKPISDVTLVLSIFFFFFCLLFLIFTHLYSTVYSRRRQVLTNKPSVFVLIVF